MVSWAHHTMEEAARVSLLIASLLLFFICIFVNFSTVLSLLIRPSLRSTLNNLCCAILLTNILFGCSEFFIHAVKLFGANLISEDYLCSSLTIIPQCYRIVSLYLILGSLFLRSLFVKHAKYISVVSKNNTLVVTDFGLPIWVTIIAFIVLNVLLMLLHPNFSMEFPNVRICRGLDPYRNEDDISLQFQIRLMSIIGFLILVSFVVSSHLRLHRYMTR